MLDKDFVLCHIFVTNDINTPVIAIQGQADYLKKGDAREGANVEISNLVTGDLPFAEFLPIATLIYETRNGYNNAVQGRIISTDTGDDYVDWRFSNLNAAPGTASDHALLTNLLADTHGQYALLAGRTGGQVFLGSTGFAIDTFTADDAVDDTHYTILLDGSSNTVTAQLPTAVGIEGRVYVLKCVNASFQCDVATNGSETMDGNSANEILSLYEVIRIQSDGANWHIIGG